MSIYDSLRTGLAHDNDENRLNTLETLVATHTNQIGNLNSQDWETRISSLENQLTIQLSNINNSLTSLQNSISQIGTTYYSNRNDFKGLANEGTINTSKINIPAGLYLVEFSLAHCNASQITNNGAYWIAILKNNNGDTCWSSVGRAYIIMAMASRWDQTTTAYEIYNLPANQYYVTFQNFTGIKTDTTYNNAVRFSATRLK